MVSKISSHSLLCRLIATDTVSYHRKFDYFDEPDKDGYEWKATYQTPIWTNARCFDNNKVVKCADGGYTDGCSGTG